MASRGNYCGAPGVSSLTDIESKRFLQEPTIIIISYSYGLIIIKYIRFYAGCNLDETEKEHLILRLE